MADFEYSWYTELLTYTAATVVIAVDNSTTVTKSSTIQAARFVIPESLGYAVSTVRDSLVTRVLGGIAYTLTYPTVYRGVADIQAYSTYSAINSAGSVSCVWTKIVLSGWFDNVSNAPPDPLSAYSTCSGYEASPPQFLLRVSTLTAVSTSYIGPQAASSKILPSPTLSSPTVRVTTMSSSYAPSSAEPSQHPTNDASEPPNHSVPDEQIPASNAVQSSLSQTHLGRPAQPSSESAQIVSTVHTPKVAHPTEQGTAEPAQAHEGASAPLTNPVAQVVYVSGKSMTPGGSPIIEGTKVVGYSSGSLHVDNSAMQIPSESNPSSPVSTVVNGLTFSVVPRPSPVSPIISSIIPPTISPILTSTIENSVVTADSSSHFLIGSQTLVTGDAPITVSGTLVSSVPSGTALTITSSSMSNEYGPSLPVLIIESQQLTADSTEQYTINGQTLFPGGLITISGGPFSLMPSAAGIIQGSRTSLFSTPRASAPRITIGFSAHTANAASKYIVDGQTLAPGSAIIISGTVISIDAKGTAVTLGTSTQTAGLGSLIMNAFGIVGTPPISTVNAPKGLNQLSTLSPLTIDKLTFSANATETVLSGTTYAVGAGATPTTVVVGNETLSVGPNGMVFPSTTVAVESSTGVSPVTFTGGASREYRVKSVLPLTMPRAGILLMVLEAIMVGYRAF